MARKARAAKAARVDAAPAAKPAFSSKAEAAGWADQMEAQVKAKQRPDDAETRQAIAAARAFAAPDGGPAAGG